MRLTTSFYGFAMAEQDATKPTAPAVSFPVLDKSLTETFQKHFPAYVKGLVRSDPGGFVFTQKYAETFNDYLNIPLREDDVWIVTFPKCGKKSTIIYCVPSIYLVDSD